MFFGLVSISSVYAVGTCDSVYGCDANKEPLSFSIPEEFQDLQGVETGNVSLIDAIVGWTNFALGFVAVVAIGFIVYGGFLYMTAAGDEDGTKKGTNIIIQAIIGIIIIISAYAIVNTFIKGKGCEYPCRVDADCKQYGGLVIHNCTKQGCCGIGS
ncbi:MAG: hypothetical protein NTZ80_02365 [Patescibacteria group bacterium]|nr:hypothetical protein [Patescibacteria group bacterium]